MQGSVHEKSSDGSNQTEIEPIINSLRGVVC